MPELTAIHLGLLVLTLISGAVLGWLLRGSRATRDKIAVNAGWQEQLESQQSEHLRLAEQNKSLMEQISQYQGNNKESSEKLNVLKASLNESFNMRESLQQQLKEYRSSLQMTVAQHDKIQSAYDDVESRLHSTIGVLEQKDDKIARLKRELANWAGRLPPLVEKFKSQTQETAKLRAELADAQGEIAQLEAMDFGGQTRIEPASSKKLPDGMRASNEPHADDAGPYDPDWRHPPDGDDDFVSGDADESWSDRRSKPVDSSTQAHVGANEVPLVPIDVQRQEPPVLASESGPKPADDDTQQPANLVVDSPYQALSPGPHSSNGHESGDAFASSPTNEPDADDLKMIKGIGPAIERTLNDLGIYRYAQIADMSEYDIDRVAQQLKGFRSRIYREDWLGQARDLHYQNNKRLT